MTILEWLHTIKDEDVKAKAIRNYKPQPDPVSLKQALVRAFIFMDSPEGHTYWYDIVNTL